VKRKEKTMRTTLKILLVMMICSALAVATGCATGQKMPKSGFLKSYSGFTKDDPRVSAKWSYINDRAVFGAYNKVMIDHVTLFIKKEAKYRGFQADEAKELSDLFHKALVKELSSSYVITDKPGEGVLRFRFAITELVPGKPIPGTLSTVVPIGLGFSTVKMVVTGAHIGVGECSIEAEGLDSRTGEVLAAIVDHKVGAKRQVTKGLKKWGHVEELFNTWAKNLREGLDRFSGRR
jgi:hypothetical protein